MTAGTKTVREPSLLLLRAYYDLPAIDWDTLQRDDRAKMNWSFLIGPLVFLVVLAAILGAFPLLAKKKPPESDLVALPDRGSGDFDPASVPEFKSTWKEAH